MCPDCFKRILGPILKSLSPQPLTSAERKRLRDLLTAFKKTKVLVIGDFILDQFIWGSVDRISPEAPVPVVNVERESYMPGGSLNVANNIHALGGTVYPCGTVGRDREGRLLLKVIRRHGIDTGGIVYAKDRPTTLKTRVIAHSQQMVRFDREKNQDISEEISKKILKFVHSRMAHCDVVILEDYGKGVIQPGLIRKVVQMARKYRKPVLVDPKEKNFPFYKGVTAVTPNRKEAYSAFNHAPKETPLEKVGRGLLKKWNCSSLLITLGEGGMALFEKNQPTAKIPTAAREVYDVSGAGDTVMAAFALALAAKAKMREAALLSNLAAGIVVGKLGTATVLPQELEGAIVGAGLKPAPTGKRKV